MRKRLTLLALAVLSLPLLAFAGSLISPSTVEAAPAGCYNYKNGTEPRDYDEDVCTSAETPGAGRCYLRMWVPRNAQAYEEVDCATINWASEADNEVTPPASTVNAERCVGSAENTSCVGDEFIDAGAQLPAGTVGACGTTAFLGLPNWWKYLEMTPEPECAVVGPKETVTGTKGETYEQLNMPVIVARVAVAIVEILLRLASVIAVGYVIYGGIRYITSQGDPENAKSARQTIINALIGMVISLIAAQLVGFITVSLTS